VRINVEVPTHLSAAQRAKLQEFGELTPPDSNPIIKSFIEKAKRFFR
jgi:DnaJ-class molecular chaperone